MRAITDIHHKQIGGYLEKNYSSPSYERLAVVFNRSKASVFDAIHEKETQAKHRIAEGQERREARTIAGQQLIEEEKQKLKREKENSRRNEQIAERTPHTLASEDICSEEK